MLIYPWSDADFPLNFALLSVLSLSLSKNCIISVHCMLLILYGYVYNNIKDNSLFIINTVFFRII